MAQYSRETQERRWRERHWELPLAERQAFAKNTHYYEGLPYNEDDIRKQVRRFREFGDFARADALKVVTPPSDVMERRLGSLTPAEVGVIFEQEWPEAR